MTLDDVLDKQNLEEQAVLKSMMEQEQKVRSKFQDKHIYKDAKNDKWVFFKEAVVYCPCLEHQKKGDNFLASYNLVATDFFYPLDKYLYERKHEGRVLDSRNIKYLDEYNVNWLYMMDEFEE